MRRWLVGGGVLLHLLGTIWILQGMNVLGGSRMTGDPFWAVVGGVLIAIGTLLMVVSLRRGRVSAGG
jgi:hypothetical protein